MGGEFADLTHKNDDRLITNLANNIVCICFSPAGELCCFFDPDQYAAEVSLPDHTFTLDAAGSAAFVIDQPDIG